MYVCLFWKKKTLCFKRIYGKYVHVYVLPYHVVFHVCHLLIIISDIIGLSVYFIYQVH